MGSLAKRFVPVDPIDPAIINAILSLLGEQPDPPRRTRPTSFLSLFYRSAGLQIAGFAAPFFALGLYSLLALGFSEETVFTSLFFLGLAVFLIALPAAGALATAVALRDAVVAQASVTAVSPTDPSRRHADEQTVFGTRYVEHPRLGPFEDEFRVRRTWAPALVEGDVLDVLVHPDAPEAFFTIGLSDRPAHPVPHESLKKPRKTRRERVTYALSVIASLCASVGAQVGLTLWLGSDNTSFHPPKIVLAPNGRGVQAPTVIRGSGLFLVPMDGTPRRLLARIGKEVSGHYGLKWRMLGRIRSERGSFEERRNQLGGGALVDELSGGYPTSRMRVAIIGITNGDLYWEGAPTDRFAFATVAGTRYAVVSTARLDPRNWGARDVHRLDERLEKLVTRYVGSLYFRLLRADDSDSVMRTFIRSLADVDSMSDDYCPQRPSAVETC
jgi:predicted Zn-dependent protease